MKGDTSRFVPYVISTPAAILVTCLGIVPLGLIFYVAFQTHSTSSLWQATWTLDNYTHILSDSFYISVIGNSVRIALITVAICACISYPLAYHLAKSNSMKRAVCMFLVLCPLMVSTVINSFGWIVVLGRFGLVNNIISAFGLERQTLLNSEFAVIIGMVHLFVPFMTLPLMAAIERMPHQVEEASRSLGAGPIETFFLVVFPLSLPGLVGGAVITVTLSFSAVVIPVFLGGRQLRMIGPQIYDHIFSAFNWPLAAALATLAICVSAIAIMISSRSSVLRARRRSSRVNHAVPAAMVTQ